MLGAGATDIFVRYVISAIDEGTKVTVAGQRAVQVEVRATNVSFEQQAAVQKQVTAAATAAARAVSEEAAAAGKQAAATKGAAAATRSAATANEALATSAAAATGAMRRSTSAAALQGTGMVTAGAAVSGVGKKLAGLTLPIAAVALGSAKLSADFSRSMEMVHTQAGAPQAEVDNLKGKVLDLAKSMKFEQSPNELAGGLFHLESIGLRGAKALDTLKVAADGAAVGQADLEDTATALGSAWLVNIKGAGDLHEVMGVLNATVGAGNMRMGDLVQALGTGVLPAAKQAGLSLTDVMGALAVFTDEGYNASSAAAQFSTALHFLYNPTDKARTAMDAMNLSGDKLAKDMHKPQGLLVALKDLKSHLEDAGKASDKPLKIGENTTLSASSDAVRQEQIMGAILPGGRGRIMLTLLNQLDRYEQKMGVVQNTARNFAEDVTRTQDTASFKIKAAWKAIEAGLVDLGSHVLPILVPVFQQIGKTVESVASSFGDLPHSTKSLIVAVALLAAALGPVVRLTGGLLVGFGRLSQGFDWLGKKIAGVSAANTELAATQASVAETAQAEATAVSEANAAVSKGVSAAAAGAEANTGLAASESEVAASAGAGGLAAGGLRAGIGGAVSRIPKALGIAGAGYFGSQIVGGAVGGTTGDVISTVGGDAAIGAGLGSLIAPGLGTAIGAVGGAVVGGLTEFFKSHKKDIAGALLDTLNLKDREIKLHLGQISISEEDQKKYTDALKTAQHDAEVQGAIVKYRLDTTPANNKHLADQITSSYIQAAGIAEKAFETSVSSGPKYTTGKVLLTGFLETLKDVPLASRGAAVKSMISFSEGLAAEGRLPKAQLKDLVKNFGMIYDTGITGADKAGRTADKQLAAGLAEGQARAAAQNLMRDLSQTFAFIPNNITLTTDDAKKQVEGTLVQLRGIAKHAHGQEAADAKDAYNQLLASYNSYYGAYKKSYDATYTDQLNSAKKTYGQLKDYILGTLRDLRTGASSSWKGILSDALGSIKGVLNGIGQLASPNVHTRGQAFKHVGSSIATVTHTLQALFGAREGGLVPSMVSPGEQIFYGDQYMTVPGPAAAADNTFMMLPPGAAVVTGHGQQMMASGASLSDAINYQMPHFAAGGWVQAKGNLNRVFKGHFLEQQKGYERLSPQQITNLATGAGFGNDSSHMMEISHGESQFFPGVIQHDPGDGNVGYGLTQITPHSWGVGSAAGGRLAQLGGIGQMLNPVKNLQMAKYLYDAAKAGGDRFQPWHGTKYLTAGKGYRGDPSASTKGGKSYSYASPIIYKQDRYRSGLLGGTTAFDLGYDAGEAGDPRPIAALAQQLRTAQQPAYKHYTVTATAKQKKGASSTSASHGYGSGVVGLPAPGHHPSATGHSVPTDKWNPLRKPIANWIIPYLGYGSKHGWHGSVSSGFRTFAEQKAIYDSGKRPAAVPGTGNHEGDVFPRGAVDVTQSSAPSLQYALANAPFKEWLFWAATKDLVHFSYPHDGGYRRGGVVGSRFRAPKMRMPRMPRMRTGGRVRPPRVTGTSMQPTIVRPITTSYPQAISHSAQPTVTGTYQDVLKGAVGGVLRGRKYGVEQLANVVDDAGSKVLDDLRHKLVKEIRAGGQARTINRLRTVLDSLDMELGYRVGATVKQAENLIAGVSVRDTAVDRHLRTKGVDSSSVAGLTTEYDASLKDMADTQKAIVKMNKAAREAAKAGQPAKAREIKKNIAAMQDSVSELAVKLTETYRAIIVAQAQKISDDLTTGISQLQTGLSNLETIFNVSSDSVQGLQLQSWADTAAMGATTAAITAIQAKIKAASDKGDTGTVAQLTPILTSLQEQLGTTYADWVKTVRDGILKVASDAVDVASQAVDGATNGQGELGVLQQISTAGGSTALQAAIQAAGLTGSDVAAAASSGMTAPAQTASYINSVVLPRLQTLLAAQQHDLEVARSVGADPSTIASIISQIGSTQSAILSGILEASQTTADNTESLTALSGSTGFELNNQGFTDLISVGVGA